MIQAILLCFPTDNKVIIVWNAILLDCKAWSLEPETFLRKAGWIMFGFCAPVYWGPLMKGVGRVLNCSSSTSPHFCNKSQNVCKQTPLAPVPILEPNYQRD